MQVNNCSNQNFKGISFTPRALKSMSERLPSGKFIFTKEYLEKKFKESNFDVLIDTTAEESIRLCAKIKLSSINKLKNIIPQYFEECIFSSVFNKTEKFFEKLCQKIDKNEMFLLGKISRNELELTV